VEKHVVKVEIRHKWTSWSHYLNVSGDEAHLTGQEQFYRTSFKALLKW